jgi:hypothetical protein
VAKPPTYVGTLVGLVDSDGREIAVQDRVLGVHPDYGLMTAATRADLRKGFADTKPKAGETLDISALLYDRERQGYPGRHWIHETPGAQATLDKSNPPLAYLDAPDETRCDMAGDFLCSESDRSKLMATRRSRSTSRRSSARKSNPPARSKRSSRTSGTKKGMTRRTSRKAYEGLSKGRKKNPPLLRNPLVQGALSGAAAAGVSAAVDNFMKASSPQTRDITKIAAIAAGGALLGSNMIAKGAYKDAGAAMIGVATYEAVDYAKKMAQTASTSGLVYDPLGVPTVSGLVYDPLGQTLNPNASVTQFA